MRRLTVLLIVLGLAVGWGMTHAVATPPDGHGPQVAPAVNAYRAADTMDGNQAPAYVPVAAGSVLQPAATETHVLSNFSVLTDNNGRTNLPEFSGAGDGVRGALCSGAYPDGGTLAIPSQVVTRLLTDLTHMRVFQPDGDPLRNRSIRVNCTLEVELGAPAAAKIAALAAQTRP